MHPSDDVGLWAQCFDEGAPNRPALFLDRDGVVVEETHFLRRIEDVRLTPGIAEAIARANAADIPVVLVTNQSGIARGHFGWAEFMAVQGEIVDRLTAEGARLAAVFACAHHAGGQAPFDREQHPWRKPEPGMLLAARDRMALDLSRSFIIGDRVSDLAAGHKAGLRGGTLVLTGYGPQHLDAFERHRDEWAQEGYDAAVVADPALAIADALAKLMG